MSRFSFVRSDENFLRRSCCCEQSPGPFYRRKESWKWRRSACAHMEDRRTGMQGKQCVWGRCWRRTRANTRKCLNAQRATAQCSADAQTGQTGRVYRSDRLSPGRPAVKPTNVAWEGPVGAGIRRVVLRSAVHLERPQLTYVETTEEQQIVDWKS